VDPPPAEAAVTRLARAAWLLAAGTLLLAALAWLEPGLDRGVTWRPLTDLSGHAVQGVRLFDRGGLVLALERSTVGWSLVAPKPGPADAARVERLLGLLSTPSLRQVGRVDGRLGEFGLDDPEVVLEIDGLPIAFGGLDPASGHRYVAYRGEVHLIGDGYRHHLLAGPDGFRAPAP
jgi:hypothetical protein